MGWFLKKSLAEGQIVAFVVVGRGDVADTDVAVHTICR